MTREEIIKELKEYEDGIDLEYATPFDKAILHAIEALEKAPSWIPVTERLPEEGQFVIVSYPYDASDYSRKRVMTAWYHKEYGFTCGIADAWLPLPEPYNAESEET